jgi:hypothetical protein
MVVNLPSSPAPAVAQVHLRVLFLVLLLVFCPLQDRLGLPASVVPTGTASPSGTPSASPSAEPGGFPCAAPSPSSIAIPQAAALVSFHSQRSVA